MILIKSNTYAIVWRFKFRPWAFKNRLVAHETQLRVFRRRLEDMKKAALKAAKKL